MPVERRCECYDVPILPKQDLLSSISNIGYGNQNRNILPYNNIFGNQFTDILPFNQNIASGSYNSLPFNMLMPNRMVTTRSLSALKMPTPMQQLNGMPNFINDFRRNDVINLKSRLAELAGLAMSSANILSTLPSFSNNLYTNNNFNPLPMQDLTLSNLGFRPNPYNFQNNLMNRVF